MQGSIQRINSGTCFTVAMLTLGPKMDYETMCAHIELGNDGAAMQHGMLNHYFEKESVLPVSLWSECDLHSVLSLTVIWQRGIDDGEPPLGHN